jgi:acetyl-CoA carboxylase biotin carboxyl carrier protein
MVGIFYAAPSPDAEPYVKVGDKIKKGDVLCIVEAMKIMNEITSEVDGVVTELCVSDRQIVEYGHPLFRIRLSELAAQPETT